MKKYKLSGFFLLTALIAILVSCEDQTTTIGSDIVKGEVAITIDTLYYNLYGKAVEMEKFDSKSGNLLIGSIQSEKYGSLSCSFVTRLMCASSLDVADTLFNAERVDSCKLLLGALRSGIVGDSLAPQKMTVYSLTQQLPSDINNTFNPEGYYNPQAPMGSKSYTVSEIASSDSTFYHNSFIDLSVNLPVEFGRDIFQKYKDDPSIFEWPHTMAEKFLKGLYVKPSFGNGCIANIQSLYVGVYYHSLAETEEKNEQGDTITVVNHINHLTIPFSVSPEVLSSNNITYIPSDYIKEWNNSGSEDVIITTPGGYIANFIFPAEDLINRYQTSSSYLSTVNDLVLYIPGEEVDSEAGISIAENILLIKTSEYESFFNENKVPDNQTSFTGVYDPDNGWYYFTSMRSYFLDLLAKDTISEEDIQFSLIPVEIETETVSNYYGTGSTYVTKCVPTTSTPTMTLLNLGEAMVTFSFSTQLIE